MRKLMFLIIIIVISSSFTFTDELSWDNGIPGGQNQNKLLGAWFIMPFTGQGEITSASFYLVDDANAGDPFDIWITQRATDGLPDEGNYWGVFNYAGGETSGGEWLTVDLSSLNLHLPSGTEFYIIFDPRPSGGLPKIHQDTDNGATHNSWRPMDDPVWHDHNGPHFMIRVNVDSTTPIQSTSIGSVKALFE